MTSELKKGEYAPPSPSDTRSPCPAINALANHGILPRNGRDVHVDSVLDGMDTLGLGRFLAYIFAHPIYIERPKDDTPKKPAGWGTILAHPFNYLFGNFAMRNPGQTDKEGKNVLNLDQLALHNVVEHDISLSRYDFAQGDNITPQPELIEDLIACSSNGKTITFDDLIAHRNKRIAKQKETNPEVDFKNMQVIMACAETALILKVLGDGHEVPVSYVKAFFQEGRIPYEEGWKKDSTTLGFISLNVLAQKVQKAHGYDRTGAIAKVVPLAAAVPDHPK